MPDIRLQDAQGIVAAALGEARRLALQPIIAVLLDTRAAVKCVVAEDGVGTGRFAIAFAKANGALAMGIGSRGLAQRARDLPVFYTALASVIPGGLIAAPGGVLIHDAERNLIGALGISGDLGDNDERAAIAGIEQCGLTAVAGDPSCRHAMRARYRVSRCCCR